MAQQQSANALFSAFAGTARGGSGISAGLGGSSLPKRRRDSFDDDDGLPPSKRLQSDKTALAKKRNGNGDGSGDFDERADEDEGPDIEGGVKDRVKDVITKGYLALGQKRELEQFDQETWEECKQFFGITALDTDSPRSHVHIYGTREGFNFYEYQAYAIYWMLKQERKTDPTIGGGFLADEQGVGKTCEALGLLIVSRLLTLAHFEVDTDRRRGTELHLPLGDQDEDSLCPSEESGVWKWGICCPCIESGPSAKLKPTKKGPALIFAPPQLLENWRAEFNKMIDTKDNPLEMEFLLRHQRENARHRKEFKTTIPDNRMRNMFNSGMKPPSFLVRQGQQSRIIIATGPDSYKKHVLEVFVVNSVFKYSRLIYDECHTQKGAKTNIIKLLKTLRGLGGVTDPYFWALSGTPFDRSPDDLTNFLAIWRARDWDDDSFPMASEANFKRICGEHAYMAKAGHQRKRGALKTFLTDFSNLLRTVMIRRTTFTRWLGGAIVNLPEAFHKDFLYSKNSHPLYDDDLTWLRGKSEWEVLRTQRMRAARKLRPMDAEPIKRSSKEYQTAGRMLRICATVPFVARLLRTSHPEWKLTAEELREEDYYKEDGTSPYEIYLRELVNSSWKFRSLERVLLKRMDKDHLGRDEKLIIFSNFPAVAFITYLWLKKFTKRKVILIHAHSRLREEMLMDFQGSMTVKEDHIKNEASEATILVSTPSLIGIGFTLTRAFRVALMEPAWLRRDENQAYSRIRRVGQLNKRTESWRFFTGNSKVEQVIMNRQKNRNKYNELTFRHNDESQGFWKDVIKEQMRQAGETMPSDDFFDTADTIDAIDAHNDPIETYQTNDPADIELLDMEVSRQGAEVAQDYTDITELDYSDGVNILLEDYYNYDENMVENEKEFIVEGGSLLEEVEGEGDEEDEDEDEEDDEDFIKEYLVEE